MAAYPTFGLLNPFRGRKPPKLPRQTPMELIPPPSRPPTGYYDPSIDAQVAAGARGLGDLRIDVDTGKRRGGEDFASGLTGLTQSRDRTLADLLTNETRTNEDYGRATANLGLSFQRLQRGQAEAARAHGVASGGLAAQASRARDANQAREQSGLDLSRDRALADIGTQRGRVGEDFTTQSGLLQRNFDRQFGSGGDLDLQLARGEREQPFLESDANALRLSQAIGAGYVPPKAKYVPVSGASPLWPQLKKPKRPRGGGSGIG